MAITTIPIASCCHLIESGKSLSILDVRTPGEFARVHALGAHLMPLDQLDSNLLASRRGGDEPLYVICQSGARAAKACEQLQNAGLLHIYCIEGGTTAWEKSGLPVERGDSNVISLERQVRIGAGLLVLAGLVLAWTIHRAFIAIPTFVGAGLTFAGITDYCGMAMLLAKMPWNRGLASVSTIRSMSR